MTSRGHGNFQAQTLDSSGPQQVAGLNSLVRGAAAVVPRLLLFAVGYAFAYQYAGGFDESMPSPLWLPDSVLLCVLLLAPIRLWVLYLLTGFAIRIVHGGVPFWFLLVTYLNDGLKAAFSAFILKRFSPGAVRLDNVKQFGLYVGTAVIAMPALSALAGAATRLPLGGNFWPTCVGWFLGDATAALALTPTILYWCQGWWRELKAQPLRFSLLILSMLGCLYFTFFFPHTEYSPAVLYASVPILILASTTLRPIGVSTAISLLALVSIVSAAHGSGPFFPDVAHHSVLSMQLFLVSIAGPMLFVAILIAERRAVESELRHSQNILREKHNEIHDLAGKLLSAQEDERRRLARELHDDFSQRLALLSIGLEELNSGFSPEMEQQRALASALHGDLKDLATDVHDLSHRLHSRVLELHGLEGALKNICSSVSHQHRVTVELHSDGAPELPAEVNLCLFRVAQEAISNAVKHGHALRIDVLLRKQEDCFSLKVHDDGVGFDITRPVEGLGLASMHERVRFVGGILEIRSRPDEGTELNAMVPLVVGASS